MNLSEGKQWPIGVITATILIIIACGVTIYIALLQPVQEDGDMMMDYQTLDTHANDIIVAGVIFNKKYTLKYTGKPVSEEGSVISYTLVDKNGKAVNNATFEVVLSRPIISGSEIMLANPIVKDGSYTFEDVKVSKKGRWNILAKVSVGNDFRHMNLKSDTRESAVYEYGFDNPMRNAGANN